MKPQDSKTDVVDMDLRLAIDFQMKEVNRAREVGRCDARWLLHRRKFQNVEQVAKVVFKEKGYWFRPARKSRGTIKEEMVCWENERRNEHESSDG